MKELLDHIKHLKPIAGSYYVVSVFFTDGTNLHSTITPNNKEQIQKDLLESTIDKNTLDGHGFSDASMIYIKGKTIKSFDVKDSKEIEKTQKSQFTKNITKKIYKKKTGAFFPYSHRIENEYVESVLEQIQIFKNDVLPIDPNVCFIEAIKGQIPDDIIEKIKYDIRNEFVPVTTVKRICKLNNIFVKIRMERTTSKSNIICCGQKDCEFKADVCCIEKHYFKYIAKTNITSYFLNNYDEVKNEREPNKLYRVGKRSNDRGLNSFMLVNELLKLKDKLLTTASYDLIKQFKCLKIEPDKVYTLDPEKCCRPIDCSLKKEENDIKRIFFDCETYKNHNNKHIPYMVSCINDKDEVQSFTGKSCFDQFLNHLSDKYGNKDFKSAVKLELYAHNSTYDGSFMMNKLMNLKILEKDSRYVSLQGTYRSYTKKYVHLLIKDSYRLIPMKLSDIPETCGFSDDAQKEIMYYDMFNYKTIDNIRKITRRQIIEYIEDFNLQSQIPEEELTEKQNSFFKNLKDWNCVNIDNTYDLMKYSEIYCIQDCKVLKKGLESWYELFRKVDIRINVYQFYSLPSLADYYFKINGCFEGCYEMNGALGTFFQNFVSGGRVCSKNNEKHLVDKNIQDFDAVSLYPSAMHLFDGYLKGVPKRIDTTKYEELKKYDGYYVKIKITSVGKKQQIPVLNYFDKQKGTKNWTNDMVGQFCYYDKTGLEDAIEFQQIEFEIIDGYYYNDGFNTQIKESIKHLFDKRLEAKKAGNDSLQQIYKLLMNSSYGKLIQKTPDCDVKYMAKEDLLRYVTKYYNHIKSWSELNNSSYLRMETYKCLDESYSSPHLGSAVLSYSKRLMNRVICLANDNNINVYYTDTDSIHIDEDGVEPLSEKYKELYGKELIGKSLGQFHCDFDFKGMTYIRSTGLIILGKKCYIDKLEGTDKNGIIQNKYHMRLKGISESAIENHIKKEQETEPKYNAWDMYKELCDGKSIEFDLMVNNKVKFVKGKQQEYSTFVGKFRRNIKF